MDAFQTFQFAFVLSCIFDNSLCIFREVWQNLPAGVDTYCPADFANSTQNTEDVKERIHRTHSVFNCCYDCNCAEICVTIRNCSFPKANPNWNKECLVPSSDQDIGGISSYNMVSTNPREGCKNDMLLHKQCGEVEEDDIGTIYPISSKTNRIIYKNPTCARCYGETDLLPWDVKYICSNDNIYPKESVLVDVDFLHELCHIEFSYPLDDDSDIIIEECIPEKLFSCLPRSFSTGQGHFVNNTEYDPIQCLQGHVSNIHSMVGDSWYDPIIIFKNTYCWACTRDSLINQQFMYEKSCLPSDANVPSKIAFSSMIDVSVIKSAAKIDGRSKCSNDNDYNGIIVNGSCRDILCPLGQLRLSNGSCKQFTVYWDSAIRQAFIKLTHAGRNSTCSGKTDFIDVQLTNENPWLSPWKIQKVFFETTANNCTKGIVFIVELRWVGYLNLKTPTKSFLEQFQNNLLKDFPLIINGENVEFKQSFSSYRPVECERKHGMVTYHVHWEVTRTCDVIDYNAHNISIPKIEWINIAGVNKVYGHPSLTVSKMLFCNMVVMQPSEYSELPDKQLIYLFHNQRYLSSEEYVKHTGMQEKKTVKLCVSDSDLDTLDRSDTPSFLKLSLIISLPSYFFVFVLQTLCVMI